MLTVISAIGTTSLIMSVLILALALFNHFLSKQIPARWRYYVWLIVIIGLLIPFRLDLGSVPTQVEIPATETVTVDTIQQQDVQQDTQNNTTDQATQETAAASQNSININWQQVVFIIWVMGCASSLGYHAWKNYRFQKLVKRWGVPASDEKVIEIYNDVKEELGLQGKEIELKVCDFVSSPMLIGMFKPTVLIPSEEIPHDDLYLVLKHELTHYRRKDLWFKALIILTTVIHWFNPIVYFMARAIQIECEASCDEEVLKDSDIENRKLYGEAIIGFIGRKPSLCTAFSTNFYGGKNTMKKRLLSIMDGKKKSTVIAVACAVVVLVTTLICGPVLAGSDGNSSSTGTALTVAEAKEIALEKTGGGNVVKCHQDEEDGRLVYDVEVTDETRVYSMDIGMYDGAIYNYEEELIDQTTSAIEGIITSQKAQEIALAKTGGGTVTKCELDVDGGVYKYEIEIINGSVEYSMDINATTSEIYGYEEEAIAQNNTGSNNNSTTNNNNSKNSTNNNTNSSTANNTNQITADKAKEIALAKAGGGTVVKCEFDYDDGVAVYEIEIINGSTEHSMDINASTGAISDYESEPVDYD